MSFKESIYKITEKKIHYDYQSLSTKLDKCINCGNHKRLIINGYPFCEECFLAASYRRIMKFGV